MGGLRGDGGALQQLDGGLEPQDLRLEPRPRLPLGLPRRRLVFESSESLFERRATLDEHRLGASQDIGRASFHGRHRGGSEGRKSARHRSCGGGLPELLVLAERPLDRCQRLGLDVLVQLVLDGREVSKEPLGEGHR